MEELKIEPGRFYRLRNGRKMRCYAIDGCRDLSIHGATKVDEGWKLGSWYSDGKAVKYSVSTADIISEWEDKPEIDWSLYPSWVKAVAMDKNRVWYTYIATPIIWDGENFWDSSARTSTQILHEYAPKWVGDWRNSLVVRPE